MTINASDKPLVVIAVGGNSLIKDKDHMSVKDQLRATSETSHFIAGVLKDGYRVVITHGNGPQVGFMLIRSEAAKKFIHQVPLDSLVADTQGAVGYQIGMTLINELRRSEIHLAPVTIVTQVLVDQNDPAFENPTKPVGPFYSEADAQEHQRADGWIMKEDAGRGWRRVVPSPKPLKILEEPVIRNLVDNDFVVVACGGGGIPVIYNEYNDLIGCAAVIDKDTVSSMLASELKADKLVISTGVSKVAIRFGKPDQRDLDSMTLAEARQYAAEGEFAPGSMLPKIEAAIAYLEKGGREVIITDPEHIREALAGKQGTHLFP
ncbi:MAG: carbamate kinase [Kiritimatiellae bacterium]|nr:carbamate kinase [Kiritimatiellia bacterium]